MSVYIIGDIHGCFDTFMALLKKLPKDAKICLAGDLIDRGPKSKEVVQYVIDNDIDCVKGNHEEMMVDWTGDFNDMLWIGNGGRETLDGYHERDSNPPYLKGDFDQKTFDEHKLFMDILPYYIEYPDVKNEDGRHLVVSHSILHNVWKHRDSDDESMIKRFQTATTWGRNFHKIKDNPEIYNVFGHTPQEDKAKIRKIYANVDTGCCFKSFGEYGKLTALKYPEMELITQENIDVY